MSESYNRMKQSGGKVLATARTSGQLFIQARNQETSERLRTQAVPEPFPRVHFVRV